MNQQWVFGELPEAVLHLEDSLLKTYLEEVILVHTGLPWYRKDLENAITNGPHASACNPYAVEFIRAGVASEGTGCI